MKQKSADKENLPIVKAHVPKLEAAGIEVSPVGDLVAEMKQVSAKAARELFEAQNLPYCKINCDCGPCRVGQCGFCTEDGKRRLDADERYRQRYSEPYQDFPNRPPSGYRDGARERDLRRELAGRWMAIDGVWDTRNDAPVFHSDEERWRFRELEKYVYGREAVRRRDTEEYELERMRRMQMEYMAFVPSTRFVIPVNGKIDDEWGAILPVKDGKKDE